MPFGGRVQEYFSSKIFRRHQQHLHAHARFGGGAAPREGAGAAGVGREAGGGIQQFVGVGGRGGGSHQRHGFYGFEAAAHFASHGYLFGRQALAQQLGQLIGQLFGLRIQQLALALAGKLQGLQDAFLGLFAEALQLAHLVGFGGFAQLLRAFDAQLAPQAANFLGADAFDAQQLDYAGRRDLEQALQVRERAGVEQLGYFGGGGFAQAGAVGQAGALHLRHGEAQRVEGVGRAFDGANFERVFVVQLHQLGGQLEGAGQGAVIHRNSGLLEERK